MRDHNRCKACSADISADRAAARLGRPPEFCAACRSQDHPTAYGRGYRDALAAVASLA